MSGLAGEHCIINNSQYMFTRAYIGQLLIIHGTYIEYIWYIYVQHSKGLANKFMNAIAFFYLVLKLGQVKRKFA